MYDRLLESVRERIRNGELSERGLARLTGISQPHIHNVLKGVRLLSTEFADEILVALRINACELIEAPLAEPAPYRPVPLWAGTLGADTGDFQAQCTAGSAYVPTDIAARTRKPLAIRLGEDVRTSPRFEAGDLVLVDQGETARTRIEKRAIYLTATCEGPRLRYVRVGPSKVYLPSEQCLAFPIRWENALLGSDGTPKVVLGRVVWVSRHLERITDYC